MKAALLVTVCCLFSTLANASDPYIELAQPTNLMEVHVNSSLYNPIGNKITKTEISFGDGTVVTNKSDVYHQYNVAGVYEISVKVWPQQGTVQTFSKSIDVNPLYRVIPIANSTVFTSTSPKQNHTYAFQASSLQANRLHKVKLIKQPDASGSCALAVHINSIPLFQDNELDCNTAVIEKLVRLKASNEIIYDGPGRKSYSTEISAVELVKDYSAPVIASSLVSGGITNTSKANIYITDDSNVTTYVWDQNQNLIFSTTEKNFNISLNEGANSFVIQSKDQYDNTSSYFYLTNITRDATPASLNAILNAEYIYSTYPQDFTLTIYSDEVLQSLTINGALAFLTGPNTYSYVLHVDQPGQVDINLHAIDLAGNETHKNFSPLFSIDNIAPTVTTNLSNNSVTSQDSIHIQIVDNAATVTEVYKDGNLIKTTSEKEFDVFFEGQGFASYVIKSRDVYSNEAVDLQLNLIYDSIAPVPLSFTPEEGTVVRTNQLPINIPVAVEFTEPVVTVTVNSATTTMISPTKAEATVSIQNDGPVVVRVEAADAAGNLTIIERTVAVEYSNVVPVLTLDASVRNALTNDTEIRIFGTSNIRLANATLNGVNISVSADGLSFSGMFSPPADGRYSINVIGTDLYGNTGQVAGHVRVLVDLPEVFENYPALTAIPTATGHRINYGVGFSGANLGDHCAALKNIFTQKEEFAANLQQIQKREDEILSKFPDGYEPDVPTTDSLMEFIGNIDEPLNYVKAGYLAVCEGKFPMPETDCPKNREVFKLLTGQYPEPMLIRSIPGLAPFIQDFLISRYNICTGLDTSGLSCEDMKRLLPLVANLTFPSVGQMMSSPVGQFVMDELMCKEICELPVYKDSPVCKQPPLPQLPEINIETPISFAPPNPDFPGVDIGQDDWGGGASGGSGSGGSGGGHGGGDGGGSCGGWFSDCDDDGDGTLLCSAFPEIFFCSSGIPEISNQATYDSNVLCPDENWTFIDAINESSPTNYLSSVLSKCKTISVPAVPKFARPVITVTTPTPNQVVSNTVRVKGFVDDANAFVKINGVDIKTISGVQGAYFDTNIPTPVSRTITVEAANDWGLKAIPVVIQLDFSNDDRFIDFATGITHTCAITEEKSLKCWGTGYLGDGQFSESEEPVQVIGLESDVTAVTAGYFFTCALKSNSVYCWGTNGGADVSNSEAKLIPTVIPGYENNVISISSGVYHTCALKVDGSISCWGYNLHHALGRLDYENNFYHPDLVELIGAPGSGATSIYSSAASNCVIRMGGVTCWGANILWQLGAGDYYSGDLPTNIEGLRSNVTKVAPGFNSSCAIKSGGVWCWGSNEFGGLGIGSTDETVREYPVQLPLMNNNVTDIGSRVYGEGTNQHCAIKSGKVYCWGDRFGDVPAYVGIDNATKLSLGAFKLCALSNNKVICIDP